VHLALHVRRLACPAVTQEPGDLAHRLPRSLIGDAVNRDDGDAIGCAHRRDLNADRAAGIAGVTV
jgi:hypothetical protein